VASMGSTSETFGTEIMRYNENQLYDRFRNAVVMLPFYEENKDLLFNLDFFARFLAIYALRIKLFEVLKSSNYDATYRMLKK
jgi:hypothetical protein